MFTVVDTIHAGDAYDVADWPEVEVTFYGPLQTFRTITSPAYVNDALQFLSDVANQNARGEYEEV